MPQDGGEPMPPQENKKIAYLLDLQTICITDLHAVQPPRRQLHLFDLDTQKRSTLLNYCNYVQWVPESDVVVAQNRGNLSVWYNIRSPDKATIYQIKGDEKLSAAMAALK
ncbi:Intraflagellar transport protein 172 [Phytophthora cinnamomi]|uniref:Intraflagellar transport protein 172 n=1 Tax=Phytophthora cinnamomi TaxID=4785 RepID=UPI003559A7FB|nr:Intraflagellar transport protein 172 [Phytophthora cinnamomi]